MSPNKQVLPVKFKSAFSEDGAQRIDFPIVRVIKDAEFAVTISPECETTVTMRWANKRKKK